MQKTRTKITHKFPHLRREGLNISGRRANQKLAEAISNCGFYECRRELIYKSPFYGTKVELVERWYPSSKTCSACGHIQPMPLKERVFDCQCRSLLLNRDNNAAMNLTELPLDRVRMANPGFTPVD